MRTGMASSIRAHLGLDKCTATNQGTTAEATDYCAADCAPRHSMSKALDAMHTVCDTQTRLHTTTTKLLSATQHHRQHTHTSHRLLHPSTPQAQHRDTHKPQRSEHTQRTPTRHMAHD